MKEIRILAASSQLGAGYLESSLKRGLDHDPHCIGCDAGSTDTGPHPLGTGIGTFSDTSIKRDLRHMLLGRHAKKIPMIIGSCGTSGNNFGLESMRRIVLEIAKEEGLNFRLATIRSELSPEYLKQKYRDNKMRPLSAAPEISEASIDRSTHIVGMMGYEPIAKALDAGADVVLAGRSSDTALFAAFPMLHGGNPGPIWHAAKIIECGASCCVARKRPDSILAWIRDDHFDVEPMDPENRVTAQSVASHSLYENADPYLLLEPGGVVDTRESTYEQVNDRIVRVYGSKFNRSDEYTIKLEGVEPLGWQHVIISGVNDPYILRQLDNWLDGMREKMKERVIEMFSGALRLDEYDIHVRVYGRDGVMGPLTPEANRIMPHEVGLIFTITAPTEEQSYSIAKIFAHLASHYPIAEWSGLITGLAFPFSPFVLNKGESHIFNINHVVVPDDPYEMFPTEFEKV
ncbi:MAG: acyclic terpene utilization AtuA family protein [Proteobacteria bacterium]|nr:acyclic terpene utilization AtuA family protein [Pseudomonadota bacterium]